MNIKDFAPTPDGKYSPNLYKRLARHERRHGLRVFQFVGSRFDGSPTTLGVWNARDVWIGHADSWGLHGNSLGELISDKSPSLGWAMPCAPDFYREITDEFWETYRASGRCAWDQSHRMSMQNMDLRFTLEGGKRHCNWCGKDQYRVNLREIKNSIVWCDELEPATPIEELIEYLMEPDDQGKKEPVRCAFPDCFGHPTQRTLDALWKFAEGTAAASKHNMDYYESVVARMREVELEIHLCKRALEKCFELSAALPPATVRMIREALKN